MAQDSPPPPPPTIPRRADQRRRHQRAIWLGVGTLMALAGLIAAGLFAARTDRAPATSAAGVATTTSRPLPAACTDALALADRLAPPAVRLAEVAAKHVAVMDGLDRFLEGEPGGLNGHQVYEMGKPHMKVMAADGPDTEALAARYREVRKACPLK
jgi:hypothetical protein